MLGGRSNDMACKYSGMAYLFMSSYARIRWRWVKHAKHSLDVSLACVHRPERGERCAEVDSAHPSRQRELREHDGRRRVVRTGRGRTASRGPTLGLQAREPEDLLNRPRQPRFLFLPLLVCTQLRELACDGNSAEALLVRERVRRPVGVTAAASISWGTRQCRGRGVTLFPYVLQHFFCASFGGNLCQDSSDARQLEVRVRAERRHWEGRGSLVRTVRGWMRTHTKRTTGTRTEQGTARSERGHPGSWL